MMKMYWKTIEALPKVNAPMSQVTPNTTSTLTVALNCTESWASSVVSKEVTFQVTTLTGV